MNDYLVMWEINIPADSPREAAEIALEIQRDPDSIANVFSVESSSGETTTIDFWGEN